MPREIVHFDMRLAGLDRNAGEIALTFANGSRVRADAVIGADGVHSVVRELLLGPEKPRFTGRVAYRALFPAARLGDTRVAQVQTKWWGPDRHVVIYYVTATRDQIYFVTSVPEGAEWMTRESWSAKGDLDELRKAYSGFHAEVRAVLDACPGVYKWALLERDPLPRWSEGRVGGCRAGGCGRARALPRTDGRGRLGTGIQALRRDAQAAHLRHPGQIQLQHLDADRRRSGMGLQLRRLGRATGGVAVACLRMTNLRSRVWVRRLAPWPLWELRWTRRSSINIFS